MRNSFRKYWKQHKLILGLILFVVGFMIVGSITDNVGVSVALATVLPIAWIKEGKFTQELTENELKKLSEEDFKIYVKERQESIFNTYQKSIEDALKDAITKDDFKKLQDQIKEINKANEDNLEARIKEFEELAERVSKRVSDRLVEEEKNLTSFEISVKRATVREGDQKRKVFDILNKHNNGDKFSFNVKATFTGGDVTALTHNAGGQIIPGIGQLATAKLVLSNFFKVSPIEINGNGTATYEDWDEATITRAAAAIAEGGTFPESTAKFKTYNLQIEKIGDTISMTYEAIRDFERFTKELARFITRNVAIAVNHALWNGNGTTPNIAGIYTRVDAFNTAGYAGAKTTTPNLMDLLAVLRKQIMNGADEKYNVNFAFISWEDYLALTLKKDTQGRLIYPNGLPNVGIEIIPTSFVTDNTLVIGDKDYVELIGDPNAITVEVGYKSGDWESDKESVKARVRTALLVRNADKSGFLKVTSISDALTAITA